MTLDSLPDDSLPDDSLPDDIRACRLCAGRFSATATAHQPRPIVWFTTSARVLIASQAPGMQVHRAHKPFWDRSGARLRAWLGVTEHEFYDRERFAILPSAFCFPGYNRSGSDLPPPPVCASTWQARALDYIGPTRVQVYIGGYAHRRHLGLAGTVTETMQDWRRFLPDAFVLPHPSWRNNAWIGANPWFERDLLPVLRETVRRALEAPA